MATLPGGTVTFVFTDVEGSTKLLRAVGRERYAELLETHERAVWAAFERAGGRVVDTQGDQLFVVFASASGAVRGAVDAQSALAAADGGEESIRVRIGIHTGSAHLSENRYRGLAVHRAARICAAAHGGQIVVSQATQAVLEDEEHASGIELVDLGEQQLKDFERPVRLYQVASPERTFPPLRAAATGSPSDTTARNGQEAKLDQRLSERFVRRRRLSYVIAAVVTAAATAAVVAAARGRGDDVPPVSANNLVRIDPKTNRVVDVVAAGRYPTGIAATAEALWFASREDGTLSRLDFGTGDIVTIGGLSSVAIAPARGGVWVTSGRSGRVVFVGGRSMHVEKTIRFPGRWTAGAVVGGGYLWVTHPSSRHRQASTVSAVDPSSATVVSSFRVGGGRPFVGGNVFPESAVAFAFGALWVANFNENTISVIRPGQSRAKTIRLQYGPDGIVSAAGSIWVTTAYDGMLTRIDPVTLRIIGRQCVVATPAADLCRAAEDIGSAATGSGSIWITRWQSGSITRVDPHTREATTTVLDRGTWPLGVQVADGTVWVAVAPPRPPHWGWFE